MASSTPVTVTIWATFQLAAVKVREEVERVPSVMSELARPMTTSAVGWESRTTEKPAVPPLSVVTRPLVGDTLMPALSLSLTLVTLIATALAALLRLPSLAVTLMS